MNDTARYARQIRNTIWALIALAVVIVVVIVAQHIVERDQASTQRSQDQGQCVLLYGASDPRCQ